MTSLAEVEFTATEIPHAVYRLYDASDVLLYAGISRDLPQRMESHATDKWWWPQVARRTMVWYGSELDARTAEAIAIDAEHPLHNDVRPAVGANVPPHGQRAGWHRRPPLTVRLSADNREWLLGYAEATGRPINAIMCEVLHEYHIACESATA